MLRLVSTPEPPPPVFDPPPFQLRTGAARPGIGHTGVFLRLDRQLLDGHLNLAKTAGLPLELNLALIIESQRVVEDLDVPMDCELQRHLDKVAVEPLAPVPGGAVRLSAYAQALRSGGHSPASLPSAPLTLPVAHHTVTAWRRAAVVSGETMDHWGARLAACKPRNRHLWEASAAEHGQTLAEWIVVQAARRRCA